MNLDPPKPPFTPTKASPTKLTRHPDAFRELALRALEVHTRERTRISRFLHDEVAQFLSGAGLQLDILRMDMQERVPEIAGRTAEIQAILEEIVVRIRDLSEELNPVSVERAGLHPALDHLVGRARKQFSGTVRLLYDSSARVPSPVGEAMHRIAEQAVENSILYSGASQIEVVFKTSRRGQILEVRDDGCGFNVDAVWKQPHGLGMLVMDHFASQAGLSLEILSDSRGTIVRAILPASAAVKEP